jgi:hypothetical protein
LSGTSSVWAARFTVTVMEGMERYPWLGASGCGRQST